MSETEKQLTRIADALERLVMLVEGALAPFSKGGKATEKCRAQKQTNDFRDHDNPHDLPRRKPLLQKARD